MEYQDTYDGLLVVHTSDETVQDSAMYKGGVYQMLAGIRARMVCYLNDEKPVIFTEFKQGDAESGFCNGLEGIQIVPSGIESGQLVKQAQTVKHICAQTSIRILEVIGGWETACLNQTIRLLLNIGHFKNPIRPESIEIIKSKTSQFPRVCIKNRKNIF